MPQRWAPGTGQPASSHGSWRWGPSRLPGSGYICHYCCSVAALTITTTSPSPGRSLGERSQADCVVIRHAHSPRFTGPQVKVDTCLFPYLLCACACSIVQSNLTYKTQAPHWPVLTPSLGYSSGVCFLSWDALKMVRCIFTKLTKKQTKTLCLDRHCWMPSHCPFSLLY